MKKILILIFTLISLNAFAVVKKLEDKFVLDFRANGFPDELINSEKEKKRI